MTAAALDIRPDDHLAVSRDDGTSELWIVEAPVVKGFRLRPQSGGDPRTWTHDELFETWADGRLTHYRGPSRGSDHRGETLRARPFDGYEPSLRREALRHLAYVKEVDRLIGTGMGLVRACAQAGETVYEGNIEAWREEEKIAAHRADAVEADRRRRGRRPVDPVITLPTDLEKHSGSSVRVWYQRWIENGRDVRSLIPVKTARGNRTPRYGNRGKRLAIFESIIKNLYFRPDKRPHLSSIYDEYKVQCAEAGLSVESASSFYRRVTRTYTAREEYAGRWGRRAAYLKYGVFDLRKPPDFALSEVQVDHCLIDVFVRPPWGGKPVRPWLTVIIDVATRMVLGFHVGFHPPSYACLQRAVAHSIWPKDLSGFPEIVNEWPACGVFDLCLADNGLDLTGNSLRDTAAALDFEIMHLPVRAPWLKAIIERYFGTLNTRVFDLADGKAIYNEMEPFDPSRHATWTLDDLCYRIVKFIVDEYHTREHPGIGTTPLKRWAELSQLRAIRLPPSPDLIIGLTGEVHRAKISSTGVHIEGLTYQDHELFTRIRAERGARDRFWEFRRDPYDIGVIHLLHNGAWQHIPCTTPQAAVGVSRFQHRMHLKVARYMTGAGECVSEQTIVDARALVAAQVEDFQAGRSKSASPRQAARYSDKGTYATGIVGLTAKTPLAPSRSNEEQETVVGGSSPMVEEDLRPDEYMKDLMEEWRDG